MQRKKAKSKRRFRLNTPAEEARIQAGIKSDPDNPELTAEQFARMRPFRGLQAERRLGRPKSAMHGNRRRLGGEVVQIQRLNALSGAGIRIHVRRRVEKFLKLAEFGSI